MCGIVACIGRDDAVGPIMDGLRSLEYRGYDSAGIAIRGPAGDDRGRTVGSSVADGGLTSMELAVRKCEGEISELERLVDAQRPSGSIGIGHTRWSTHGPPTAANAHPHTDCGGDVAVVHNGIIENYEAIKARLTDAGHEFVSDTDTEIIPHLFEEYREEMDVEPAFRRTVEELDGSYAVALLAIDDDTVYAARSGSPLVLGVDDDRYFLGSDVPAFLEYTDNVVYLENGDVVTVSPDGYEITDNDDGRPVSRSVDTVNWDPEDAIKGAYDHFMLKEIHEQPSALRQTIRGRVNAGSDDVNLEGFDPGAFTDVGRVQFVAAGTSYHAARYVAHMLSQAGVPATTDVASEFATSPPPIEADTLVVAVSQSGETADTLEAIRRATAAGARTAAVTNVVDSTITRECDDALYIRAGPEIGVAATKTFSSQVVTLSLLAERLIRDVTGRPSNGARRRHDALSMLPEHVQRVVDESNAEAVAERYHGSDAYFFLGRGAAYPVALEGALKFKEITYEHAEGFPAGELKHGPLALVTEDTPVFVVTTGQHVEATMSNLREVQSRGAPAIAVGQDPTGAFERAADEFLPVPETHPFAAGVLANVHLQLLAYYAADHLGCPIDKPRNLAKSVTVQ